MTNRADAETAIELGADALGFNFYEDSKRFIDFRAEAEWISSLPPFVTRVAVVVSPSLEQAREISALPWIDMLQLHGGESPQFCAEFAKTGMPFIKAIALRDEAAAANTAEFCTRNILLDAFVPGQFGGTGHTVDFALAEKFSAQNPGVALLLSGGLTAENVAEAVRRVRPFAVDVASGVEREPRKKDRGLMRAFIEAAQSA